METRSKALPTCQICLNAYDDNIRKPYSIYPCGHSYCLACVEQIDETCPECRGHITQTVPNWELLRIAADRDTQPLISSRPNFLRRGLTRLHTAIAAMSARDKLLLVYVIFIAIPLLLVYPVVLAYAGIADWRECRVDTRIPIWLVVYGAVGILIVGVYMARIIHKICTASNNNNNKRVQSLTFALVFVLAVCELVLFFLGAVWVFSAYAIVNYEYVLSPFYCQPGLFKLAFVSLVAHCVLFGIVAVGSTCYVCYTIKP